MLRNDFCQFLCDLVHVFITGLGVDRQRAEIDGDERMHTIAGHEFEVLTSRTHLHDLREGDNNALGEEETILHIRQDMTTDQYIMAIPYVIVIAERLLDIRLRLRVELRRLTTPLVTDTGALVGELAEGMNDRLGYMAKMEALA